MSNYAHKGQILPLVNQMIPISKDTTFHASYDFGLHGFNQAEKVHPIGPERGLSLKSGGHINLPFGKGLDPSVNPLDISIWAKPDSTGAATMCLSTGQAGNSNARLYIGTNAGKWDMGIQTNGWGLGTVSVELKWTHIELKMTGAEASLYVDGVLTRKVPYSAYTLNRDFQIGVHDTGGYPFEGAVANLNISSKGVTLVHYKLSEREGPVSFDQSGEGNDGAWSGSVVPCNAMVVTVIQEGKFKNGVLIEPDSQNALVGNTWGTDTSGLSISAVSERGFVNAPVYKYSSDGTANSMNCYLNGGIDVSSSTYSSVWTWSMYVKRKDGQPVTDVGFMYMYLYAQDDNARLDTNKGPTGIIDCGGGWYRIYRSEVLSEPASVSLVGMSSLTTTTEWLFNGWQLEPRDYPTSYMPIASSRSIGKLPYTQEIINPASFTISCWFNIPYMHRRIETNAGVSGNWYHPIVEIAGDTTTIGQSFGLVAGPEPSSFLRKLQLQVPGGATGTFQIQDDTWYHMTTTYDGTTYKVYIDGVEQISYVGGAIGMGDGQYLSLGGGYRGKAFIKIDELRIESRAISAEEAAAWAASGLHYNYLDYSLYVD